jgi:chaperonin cofactor prefoldin
LDQIRHEVTEWERRRDTAKAEAQQADSDLSAARKLHNEISQRQGDLLRESTRLEGRIEQLKKEKEALEKNLGTLESQQPKPLMGGQ